MRPTPPVSDQGEFRRPFGYHLHLRPQAAPPAIGELREAVARHKLVLVRGLTPLDRDAFLEYCRQAGNGADPCLHWDFGPVMELKPDAAARNYLFAREEVPLHWDGAFHQVPRTLVFHCIKAPPEAAGGETLFCDTEGMWESLGAGQRERFRDVHVTYRTAKLAHYGGEVTVPLVATHPDKGCPVLRFAEPVRTERNPVSAEIAGLTPEQTDRLLQRLGKLARSPRFCYAHRWQRGDLLLADNHSLIHGRRAFRADAPRHIRRIQLV